MALQDSVSLTFPGFIKDVVWGRAAGLVLAGQLGRMHDSFEVSSESDEKHTLKIRAMQGPALKLALIRHELQDSKGGENLLNWTPGVWLNKVEEI